MKKGKNKDSFPWACYGGRALTFFENTTGDSWCKLVFQTILWIKAGIWQLYLQRGPGFKVLGFFRFEGIYTISVGINAYKAMSWICSLLVSLFQRKHIFLKRVKVIQKYRKKKKDFFSATKQLWQLFSVFSKPITLVCLAAQEHLLVDHNNVSVAWVASSVSTACTVAKDKSMRRKKKGYLSISELSSQPNIPLGNITFLFFSFCLLHTMSLITHFG